MVRRRQDKRRLGVMQSRRNGNLPFPPTTPPPPPPVLLLSTCSFLVFGCLLLFPLFFIGWSSLFRSSLSVFVLSSLLCGLVFGCTLPVLPPLPFIPLFVPFDWYFWIVIGCSMFSSSFESSLSSLSCSPSCVVLYSIALPPPLFFLNFGWLSCPTALLPYGVF